MDLLGKGKIIGKAFVQGVKTSLQQEWPLGVSALVGLSQGLKYKGSIKTGVAGGVATLAVITGVSGVMTVVRTWDEIKTQF